MYNEYNEKSRFRREHFCHVFDQVLIETQIYNLALKLSQFFLCLKQLLKLLLDVVILADYVSQVTLLLTKLFFDCL